MKIAFCSAPAEPTYSQVDKNKWPPLWVMSLAASVKEVNPEAATRYFDGTQYKIDHIINEIVRFGPDLVCLSPVLISYKNDLEIATKLKANVECKIVIGGHHSTNLAKNIVKNRKGLIDAVIQHDGEPAIKELCRKPIKMENIPNAVVWSNGRVTFSKNVLEPLDNTPIPWIDEAESYKHYGKINIYSQKGCAIRFNKQKKCIFCARADNGLRAKSPERVVTELKYYLQKIDSIQSIFEVCDDFLYLKKWLTELADKIVRSGIKMPKLTIFATSSAIDIEIVQALSKIGVSDVILGFESADPKVLSNVGKGHTTIDNNLTATKTLLAHGISVVGSYVFGLPGTTERSIELCFRQVETLQRESKNSTDGRFSGYANVLIPFPGSLIFQEMCSINKNLSQMDIIRQYDLQIEYIKNYLKKSLKNSEKFLEFLCTQRDLLNKMTEESMIQSVGLKIN